VLKLKRARRYLFPKLDNAEYDSITMKIFEYLNVKKKSLKVLSRLNTKGYLLSVREHMHEKFVLYLQTPFVCFADSFHNHFDELSKLYTTFQVKRIELYSDRYYVKALTVTYMCDGWRSEVKSHLLSEGGSGLTRTAIDFKKD
jgi:hypothetical protein